MSAPLLQVDGLKVHFPVGRERGKNAQVLKAVDGVSFTIAPGEALGVVGESGCGKSTLGRAIINLIKPTAGSVIWQGKDIAQFSREEMRPLRRDLQIIFQDPLSSHNPRMTIGRIIAEPLEVFFPDWDEAKRTAEVREIMGKVGLNQELIGRYPHELSGGQCQRVSIARAMILKPKLVVCDEPVSALDVSTQAQIINLLRWLRKEFGVAILFISHDLSVVRRLCERVMVMYLGHVAEIGGRGDIFDQPLHPYTKALISAAPIPDPRREAAKERVRIVGDMPSPIDPPSGCVFRTRCPQEAPPCRAREPVFEVVDGHGVACHFARSPRVLEPSA
ncbi:MAG TPA: ATP-binding cassette domain-containing protein [Terricaulis sp.]|nr:ATP-binding cassette domain-containing protein [Terricaulis sp.]